MTDSKDTPLDPETIARFADVPTDELRRERERYRREMAIANNPTKLAFAREEAALFEALIANREEKVSPGDLDEARAGIAALRESAYITLALAHRLEKELERIAAKD